MLNGTESLLYAPSLHFKKITVVTQKDVQLPSASPIPPYQTEETCPYGKQTIIRGGQDKADV